MELRGHILPPGTHSPAGPVAGRLQELRERQRGLRQALGLRLRELRRLCLQEAELTGKLPPEYPLEPGERPQAPPPPPPGSPPRPPPGGPCPVLTVSPSLSRGIPVPVPVLVPVPSYPIPAAAPQAPRSARREVALQLQVVEAARRLAAAPGLAPEQRRRRQRLQAEAAQRLRQLRAQLGPGNDENGSLCDLPVLENGALPTPKPTPVVPGRPSPPRASPGSPERRPPWAPDGRRSSLASPSSPARTLPRSASSFEGRSVPATPVLARSPCARGHPLCRPEAPGLPPRPWSGSQDSQLGGPPAPPPPCPGAPHPPQQQLRGLDRLGGQRRGRPPPRQRHPPPTRAPHLGRAAPQPEVVGAGGAAGLVPAAHRDPPPSAAPPRPRMGPPPAAETPPLPAFPTRSATPGPWRPGPQGTPPLCPPPLHPLRIHSPLAPWCDPLPFDLLHDPPPPNPGPPPGRSWRAAALWGPPSHAPPHGSGVWLGWGCTDGFNTRDLLPFIDLPGSFFRGVLPACVAPYGSHTFLWAGGARGFCYILCTFGTGLDRLHSIGGTYRAPMAPWGGIFTPKASICAPALSLCRWWEFCVGLHILAGQFRAAPVQPGGGL
ncbi:coiled-coil domain-containing protein 120 [Lathamus discolor]|uniref:coiled-coil domain-containing protein 120 n=1 Tax=Lathamus discolor TaxID=678569 RepID=UPI0032B74AFB